MLHIPREEARLQIPPTVGVIEPAGDGRSLLRIGADQLDFIIRVAAQLGCDFDVVDPPELREAVDRIGRRLSRSAGGR